MCNPCSSSSSAPTPPDPTATAQAQANAYIQAGQGQQALNSVNQQTPWGGINYYINPTTGQTVQNTTLNPTSQFQLGAQQMGGAYLAGLGLSDLNNVGNSLNQGVSTAGLPGISFGASGGALPNNSSQIQTNLGFTPGRGIVGAQNLPSVSGGSAYNFNTSNLPSLYNSYAPQFEQAFNGVLGAELPVLNQMQSQQQSQLNDQLAGQGITQGSDAYNRQQQLLDQNQSQNYNQLAAQALNQGLQTQGQLYNQTLGARQQLFGEQATQAQNQIQAQQISEAASAQNAQNTLANAYLQNAAQQQGYGQALGAAGFTNQALAQQFGQNLAAQGQLYGQSAQNAELNNAGINQSLQNQVLQGMFPIQQYGALQGIAGQVGMPGMPSYPTASIGAPDIGGYVNTAYQGAINNYNQGIASQNATLGGLLGLGGTIGAAALLG